MFEPWMVDIDWRSIDAPSLHLDLQQWPRDLPLRSMPPLPVIAYGPGDHPLAGRADVFIEPPLSADAIARGIAKAPKASAVLVQLLRETHDISAHAALTAESFAFAMLQAGAEHRAWQAAQSRQELGPPGQLHLMRNSDAIHVRIDRPLARGAIDRAMRDDLFDAFTVAAMDDGVSTLRLTGTGDVFSVGADLAEFGTTTDPVEAHLIRMRTLPARMLLNRKGRMEVHVNGACVGAAVELAAFADTVTASHHAWFHLPETAMGILPGAGGTVSMPRRIGRSRAAGMMLSGKRISATTALEWGLIDAIVNDPPFDDGHLHAVSA